MSFFERHPAAAKLSLVAAGVAVSAGMVAVVLWLGWVRAPWLDEIERRYDLTTGALRAQRILVLGDSFLARWRIETHLEADLAAWASERGVGLLNTANYGAGPAFYYEQIAEALPEFVPDLVLLFYYVGNDLTDAQYHGFRFMPDGKRPRNPLPLAPGCRLPGKWLQSEREGFDWDAMLEHGIDPELVARASGAANRSSSPEERINPWLLDIAMRAPRYLLDNILMDTECNRVAWLRTAEFLAGIFDVARAAGAEVQLIAIPASVQIDRSHFDFYRRISLEVDDRLLESRRPQELLAALCARRGIRMLDLLPRFERHPDTGSLYWPMDAHFSEAGHRLAFQIVREEILEPWIARRQSPRIREH